MSDLCGKCKFDTDITISTTNAKKKYRLTNEEIDSAGLFCFEVSMHGYGGYKYMIYDIVELAREIFAGIDDDDKRKQLYLENTKGDIDCLGYIDDMRESVQSYFEDNDIQPDDELSEFVEKIIKAKYRSKFDDVIGYIKRKIRIDNLINERDDPIFIEHAQNHKEYDAYIYDKANSTAVKTFDKISSVVERKMMMTIRKTELDGFIERKIDKKYRDLAKTLPIYKKYMNNSTYDGDASTVKKTIMTRINKKKSFDSREINLNEYLIRNYDADVRDFLTDLPIYKKYISDIKYNIELEDVQKILSKYAKRKKNIDNFVRKNVNSEHADFVAKLPIYVKYISEFDNITIEIVQETILTCVKKKIHLDNFIEKHIDVAHMDYVKDSSLYLSYVLWAESTNDFKSVTKLINEHTKRHDEITNKCGMWLRRANHYDKINKVIMSYEFGGGDVGAVIRNIKNIILESNAEKTQNINNTLRKINFTNVDSEHYDDVKFSYLVGIIKLGDAREMLKDIKKKIDN